MLQSILRGFAKRCTATAKSTKQQCQCPAAYGCNTCHKHGAHKKVVSGKDHHWFKNGQSTRAIRKDASKKLKELKQIEVLLNSDEPIFNLPFDTPIAQTLNKAVEIELAKAVKRTVKAVDKADKAKTASKKSPDLLPEK